MTPAPIPTKKYFTQKEVCQISTLSRSTVERLERSGGIPAPRRFAPRVKRYPADAILAWLDGTWAPEQQEVSNV